MKRKASLILFIIILIILFSVAVITKKSIIPNISNLIDGEWNDYQVNMMLVSDKYYSKIDDVSDILENSSVVLKVKMSNKRENLSQCVLSEVTVEDVYKNDLDINIEKDSNIYIYEPITLQEGAIYLTEGYIPMNTDNEYIVFLKPLKVPQGYTMSDKEKISFMYCNPVYGKKNMDNDLYFVNQDGMNLKFSDIKNYNVILNNENINMYNKYNEFVARYK